MGCEPLDEYYELYVLGVAADGAGDDIRDHVENGCSYCLEHLREAALSIYLLLSTRAAKPDPKLRSQLLRRFRKK